jgi:tripartite-type tricarboxylate transporter receptor subunit TctC
MRPTTRTSLRRILALFAVLTVAGSAFAQNFPSKPVTLLVPYPAGGLGDVVARLIATPMTKTLGQPVVVENLSGATGALAAQKVLNSPADGHIVLLGSPNDLILSPMVNSAIKFKSEDFRIVQISTVANMSVLARKDIPANSMDELIDYARKAARDGKPITYASVGVGSFYHLLGEQLSKVTGVPMTHIPYRGAAPINNDLIGGQVDIYISPFGKMYEDFYKQGKLKVLAILNNGRQEPFKEYPAISETSSLKNFTYTIWAGFFVKKDTPEPIVQVLYKALAVALTDPTLRANMEAQSMVIPPTQSLDAVTKLYADSITDFRAIAKSINLQPQ